MTTEEAEQYYEGEFDDLTYTVEEYNFHLQENVDEADLYITIGSKHQKVTYMYKDDKPYVAIHHGLENGETIYTRKNILPTEEKSMERVLVAFEELKKKYEV